MARNARRMVGVRPVDVFDALRDGQTYGHWVVGTRGVREVTPDWPQPGTAIHYVVGYAPVKKDDYTVSIAYEPDRVLELEAHAWPFGTLGIVIRVEPDADGSTVVIEESPKKGVLKALHNPLVDAAIRLRNVETLRRLEQQARLKRDQHVTTPDA